MVNEKQIIWRKIEGKERKIVESSCQRQDRRLMTRSIDVWNPAPPIVCICALPYSYDDWQVTMNLHWWEMPMNQHRWLKYLVKRPVPLTRSFLRLIESYLPRTNIIENKMSYSWVNPSRRTSIDSMGVLSPA